MADTIAIVNRALRQVGAQRITALNDGSPEAAVVNDVWEDVRQEFLADAPWRGATRQQSVTERVDTPDSSTGWAHWYDLDTITPLPLQVHRVNGLPRQDDVNVYWTIQTSPVDSARVLLSNASSPILLDYSHDLDDTGLQNLERYATSALSHFLAAEICQNFGKTSQEREGLLNVAERFALKAKSQNSRQDGRRRFRQSQPLVDARFGNYNPRRTGP
jgi:hypothetical protein